MIKLEQKKELKRDEILKTLHKRLYKTGRL